jgi:hypothetical protein
MDKCHSILGTFVNYDRKKLITFAPSFNAKNECLDNDMVGVVGGESRSIIHP